METITIVLVMLLAVVVSGVAARLLPIKIPLPLVQIAFGAAIGSVSGWRVVLDPDIFFLLFLPPLLFLDGWRIPPEDLSKDAGTIAELALGLVIFTVLGMGYFINWMIPSMPLAVAFALAAVLSPTDPIAVTAIAQRVPIPKRMMHILEGESMLNDASGLVCLRFAIAAALTGTFSLQSATLTFLWVAIGGLAVGFILTWVVTRAKNWVSERLGEESASQILISLLIPFGAYLLAEHLHCSGILAAVAAGLTMGWAEGRGHAQAATRVSRRTVWDIIQFTANGAIFVLLGEQLPRIVASATDTVQITGHSEAWWLLAYILGINIALAAMRFVWVWVSFRFTLRRRGSSTSRPNWRIVGAMSFAGVRGAITLAAILTLPFTMPDGSPFPARDLAILLAMGVIIVSLIVASVGLPWLLRDLEMPPQPAAAEEEANARMVIAQAAVAELERLGRERAKDGGDVDTYVGVAAEVIQAYRAWLHRLERKEMTIENQRELQLIERDLRIAAIRAERAAVVKMRRRREIGTQLAKKLTRELDLLETRYAG